MRHLKTFPLFESANPEEQAPERIKKAIEGNLGQIDHWPFQKKVLGLLKDNNVDIKPMLDGLKALALKELPAQWSNIKQGIKGAEMGDFMRNSIGKIVKEEISKNMPGRIKLLIKAKYIRGGKDSFIKDIMKELDHGNKDKKLDSDAIDFIEDIYHRVNSLSNNAIFGPLYGENGGSNPLPGMEPYDKPMHKWRDDFDDRFEKGQGELQKFLISSAADAIWG